MRKRQAERLTLLAISLTFFALGLGAKILNRSFQMALLDKATRYLWVASALVIALMIMAFFLEHYIFKGARYFWYHWIILNCLERQMIDAGIMVRHGNIIVTPKIQLSFSKDLNSATLRIRNALKYNKVLDDAVLSSALRKFVVERHYSTDDGNWYIYQLVDGAVSFKQTFNSIEEFKEYSKTIPTYKLFLDSRSTPKLQHTLLVGQTGSGKTYSVYSLLMQMLYKDVPYHLYFADPKGSSLAVIGQEIAPERTASSVEAIIESLGQFVALMRERKTELRKRLKTRIDADYSDFGMSPYIFICDEYASFASVLASSDKKTRDKVKALLYEVILQGRQLGFFLFIIMQKSDATLIDTALRDNIPLKIVLGNSEQQTYVTAFGAGVDIPNRHYSVGEGVFTEPVLAPEPKLVQFPYCNFDILQACKQAASVVVTTEAPENKTYYCYRKSTNVAGKRG